MADTNLNTEEVKKEEVATPVTAEAAVEEKKVAEAATEVKAEEEKKV